MLATTACIAALSCCTLAQAPDAGASAVFLSDHEELIAYAQQGWGTLGINTSAHAPGQTPLPLQIADQKYAKGLGHHANGEIVIDLNGQYDVFSAQVGVQPLPDGQGSVVFKVFVDDQLKFDSGTMKGGEPAKTLSVPVAGAAELRLEASDAGDGLTCDCANWAEARLTKSASPKPTAPPRRLDAAPFARVVTSDPARMKGCKAGRTEEYLQEDVYLETDLTPDASGAYAVPFAPNGPGAIGLRWLERRVLIELGIEFADAGAPQTANGVQVQYWTGESAWQGEWKPLDAPIQTETGRWYVRVKKRENPDLNLGTRRIRWVFPPAAKNTVVKRLTAIAPTPLDEVRLHLECDPKALGDSAAGMTPAEISLYNGEWTDPAGRGTPPAIRWNYRNGEPLTVALRHSRPRPWKTDRTQLLFRFPSGHAFGVAVDDVLAEGQVYVKSCGVYVTRSPATATLEDYRRKIAGRTTILEEVRRLPDQTLARALERTHNPKQDRLPTMLSLACDNHKFIVHRTGVIEFAVNQANPGAIDKWLPPQDLATMSPSFGSGKNQGLKRTLDGGWYPMPLSEVGEAGILYRQRTFVVASEDQPLPEPGWLSPTPMCVAEFSIVNTKPEPSAAALSLTFAPNNAIALRTEQSRVLVTAGERLLCCVNTTDAASLKLETRGNELAVSGEIPAGKTVRCFAYFPGWVLDARDHAQLTGGDKLADRCRAYWDRVMAPAARITVPDPLLMNTIKASQVHCLLAARNEDDGRRVAAWIASIYYGPLESEANAVIRGMDFLGHHEFARRSQDFFIHRYNPAGFLTTGYTLMGTGWQLWTIGEHYQLAHDTDWLKQIAPELARVCKWIMAQREKTKAPGGAGVSPALSSAQPGGAGISPAVTEQRQPEYGLMPPGVMADWNAYAYHFCLNAYYYAALQHAAEALADLNHPDVKTWQANAAELKSDIVRAYRWTQARMPVYVLRDGTAVPGCPSQVHSPGPVGDFFPGEDVNRSWCYDVELGAHQLVPTGVFDANDPEVLRIMDYYEDVQFLADGWFDFPSERNRQDWYNLGGFSKVQPYYCRNCEVYALRDDVKPFIRSYFNTIPSLLSLEDLAFQEHFAGAAAWNKTHETGYFLHQTRIMIVQEKKQELWLAPFVTANWMNDGQEVAIENAPTRFGPVSFRIVSHVAAARIEATIQPPTRSAPEAIVLRLRHPEGKPMRQVTINGAEHRNFDPGREIIRIPASPGPIKVVATY